MTTTNLTDRQTLRRYLKLSINDRVKSLQFPSNELRTYANDGWFFETNGAPAKARVEIVESALNRFIEEANAFIEEIEQLRSMTGDDPVYVKLPRLARELAKPSDQELEQVARQAIRAEQIYQKVAAELKAAQSTSEASCSDSSVLQR
jgi:ribosome biogenesis GTPase A